MRKLLYLLLVLTVACKKEGEIFNDASEEFPGGATTLRSIYSGSFEQPAPNLSAAELLRHNAGDANFSAKFVTSPAAVLQGLGPIFNQTSCITCHPRDGKSAQPISGDDLKGLLFRVSIPGTSPHGGPLEAPGFGTQLQNKAVVGKQGEANIQINFSETTHTFSDGTPYTLRKPTYTLINPYIPLPTNLLVSPRIGSQVLGLGLIENIRESDILAKEDIGDADGDGISGKANKVWNPLTLQTELGRFGWKAGNPTVLLQAAGAMNEDIGITSYIFKNESSLGQIQYDNLNDDPEADSQFVADVAFYVQSLAVPKRRNFTDKNVNNGKQLFFKIGCDKCHTQKYVTSNQSPYDFLNNQTIYPYTDLLLHDMGDELADNRPDFLANGKEWRTPPLWGIGLTELVNGHTNLLHDGRARSILEAIMWHGGEAENQKIKVSKLSKKDREDLVKFVGSL